MVPRHHAEARRSICRTVAPPASCVEFSNVDLQLFANRQQLRRRAEIADGYARPEAPVGCSLRERRRRMVKWVAGEMNGTPTVDKHVSH